MNGKLLIADDDTNINELLQEIFTMENYSVCSASNGQEVLDLLEHESDIDLILLDIMMPVLNGWDILSYIKEHYDVKVIVLTALSSELHEVRGFREGADDYVSKPFSRAVLLERVRRLLIQKKKTDTLNYRFHDLVLKQSIFKVFIRSEEIPLTKKEFFLLQTLMANNKITLNRDQIIEKIWGFGSSVEYRNVDTQIKMLRHSLGEYGKYICTVRGIGYYFDGEVIKE